MVIEHIYNDEIADYDVAITESQVIFPGDDLGDLPSSYENPEGIDVERQLGPVDNSTPPVHPNALEEWAGSTKVTGPKPPSSELGPYGYYNSPMGSFNQIILKDKDMNTVKNFPALPEPPSELLKQAKQSLSAFY